MPSYKARKIQLTYCLKYHSIYHSIYVRKLRTCYHLQEKVIKRYLQADIKIF